jgi:hypothetical protein
VFEESDKLPGRTRLVGGVLSNETDPYFSWQYDKSFPCPAGCARIGAGEICEKVEKKNAVDREL